MLAALHVGGVVIGKGNHNLGTGDAFNLTFFEAF
jgi:hypothetical protein